MIRSFPFLLFVFLLASCGQKASRVPATQWKNAQACSFSVRIPNGFKLKRQKKHKDQNPSDCNYTGKLDGTKVLDIYSSPAGQFDSDSIEVLYKMAVDYSKFTIRHKDQKGNWFVVSGVSPETGHSIYWKRVVGRNYISDLYFDYEKEMAPEVEPLIDGMAVSFISD